MPFQFLDLALVGRNDGIARRIDNTLDQLIDLLAYHQKVLLQSLRLLAYAIGFRIPQVAEHLEREIEQPRRGLQFAKQLREIALDQIAADRLAVGGAAPCIAKIIRIGCATALRPARGQRFAAIAAGDESPQREVFAQVFAGRSLGRAVPAVLHGQPCFQRHQRLMLGRNQTQAPLLIGDVPRIDGPQEQFVDALGVNFATGILGPCRLAFEEAFHLHNRLEAPRRIAFQRRRDDRSIGFVADEELPMSGFTLHAIAHRSLCDPIAAHGAGAHPVPRLFRILLALVLRYRRHQVFMQDTVGIVPELDGGAFQLATRLA